MPPRQTKAQADALRALRDSRPSGGHASTTLYENLRPVTGPIDDALCHWLRTLSSEWNEIDDESLGAFDAPLRLALRVLVWSYHVEQRVTIEAWAKGYPGKVRALLRLTGQWDRGTLVHDFMRDRIPEWDGREIAFVGDGKSAFRLTNDGMAAAKKLSQTARDPAHLQAENKLRVLLQAQAPLPSRLFSCKILSESAAKWDDRADKSKKINAASPDVRDLCAELEKRAGKGESLNEIARKFVGDEKKAMSLLRQARRYRHLWKSE